MRIASLLALLCLAVVAAGCGARSNTPFTAKGTIGCLKAKKFTAVTTSPSQVGLIAAFADNGGVKATSPNGNVVTLAFTANDTDAVQSTQKAFRLHAPPALRPHISDVMRTNRNVVVVWTTTPVADDETKLNGCLAP